MVGLINTHESSSVSDDTVAERSIVQLTTLVESLLFVAPEPVRATTLAAALDESPERIEEALRRMVALQEERGVRLQRHSDRVQFVTAPEAASSVERFLGLDLTTRLTPAALEALAIIAYKQPVTRAQIDEIRGVSSDGVLRTLLHRGLVEQGERLDTAGRPFHYRTTFDFLQHFGLQTLDDLPPLEDAGAGLIREDNTMTQGAELTETGS
jgi:segregation and condensation protein B